MAPLCVVDHADKRARLRSGEVVQHFCSCRRRREVGKSRCRRRREVGKSGWEVGKCWEVGKSGWEVGKC